MKPKIFVGCSSESINIAYSLQENLEFDAHITIWSQNIFHLTESTLDSLLKALPEFDFAIFIFKPEDTIILRNEEKTVVRDNIIFEFGLFLGKLGKERVSFLTPRNTSNFHLPTDLIGITPGTYDNLRIDNLNASLEPFCNKIRKKLNHFSIMSFSGFENTTKEIQNIITDKPENWQSRLVIELMRSDIDNIRLKVKDLKDDLKFVKSKRLDNIEYLTWVRNSLMDCRRLLNILSQMLVSEDSELLFAINNETTPIKIKYIVDKILLVIDELLNWEFESISIHPPEEFVEIKTSLSGWSTTIIEEILRLPDILENLLKPKEERKKILPIRFEAPTNFDKANNIIVDFFNK
ncbi:MAG: nucleotide-binding protein [Bacteroidales bacterium]|nr:nucleotide-binding protein [Bacteroidales bacterium]